MYIPCALIFYVILYACILLETSYQRLLKLKTKNSPKNISEHGFSCFKYYFPDLSNSVKLMKCNFLPAVNKSDFLLLFYLI